MAFRMTKPKFAFGLDRVPIIALKDAWSVIKVTILDLFRKIYETGIIPEQWKTGRMIPLHKKGNPEMCENYRPITNLCSLAKIFERAILYRIREIESRCRIDLTGQAQHGFKPGRSTTTAAMSIKRTILEALDKGKWSGLVSVDLSAAFDVVNHKAH